VTAAALGMDRHRWGALVKVVGTIAVTAGTAWAVYHEWSFISPGLHILTGDTNPGWAVTAVGVECLSMVAFALLQSCLLRAAGSRLTMPWLLSTAYTANAIAISVPVIGSGMATAYDYRQLRAQNVDPNVAKATLTVAGVTSTASLAVVVGIAALLSGNPAGGIGGAILGSGGVVAVVAAPHISKHARFQPFLTRCLRTVQRIVHRPHRDADRLTQSAMALFDRMQLRYTTLAMALTWGTLNWLTDASCLVLAIKAIGVPVPWHSVLLIWSAGVSAGSFSPTPDGIGVVEVTMTAGLIAAGLRPPDAVAAVLLYRIVAFKGVITTCWFGQRTVMHHRQRRASRIA
jgi:putative heme transporter